MWKRKLSLRYILKAVRFYVNSLLQGLVLILIAGILRSYIIQRANARGTLRTEISQGNQEKVQCDTRSLMLNYLHVYYTWSSLFTIENLRWTYSWISLIWQKEKEKWNDKTYDPLRNVQFWQTRILRKCNLQGNIYTLVLLYLVCRQIYLALKARKSFEFHRAVHTVNFHCKIPAFLREIPFFIAHIYI